MLTRGWRKRQLFQKINTYEGRELGVGAGGVKQIFRPAWMCSVCNRVFFTKEETETHDHKDKDDAKTQK
jgi:hypothetical protein